jgi:N utilization substance protein B
MGARSVAREAALMILFAAEAAGEGTSTDAMIEHFWRAMATDASLEPELESRTYAEQAARGVLAELARVDAVIKTASSNWRIERMSRVDRNVLRLGTWELMHDVPRAIAIDEAVDLGKRYGTEDSGSFVNGVLDRVASDLGK